MNCIIPIIAGFLSGLIGSMGFGGGGILIIYLVIFTNTQQITAQGINLVFFIPCATLATIIYFVKKQIDFKPILPIISGGIIGALIAGLLLKNIYSDFLSRIFACFLIITGLFNLYKLKINKT